MAVEPRVSDRGRPQQGPRPRRAHDGAGAVHRRAVVLRPGARAWSPSAGRACACTRRPPSWATTSTRPAAGTGAPGSGGEFKDEVWKWTSLPSSGRSCRRCRAARRRATACRRRQGRRADLPRHHRRRRRRRLRAADERRRAPRPDVGVRAQRRRDARLRRLDEGAGDDGRRVRPRRPHLGVAQAAPPARRRRRAAVRAPPPSTRPRRSSLAAQGSAAAATAAAPASRRSTGRGASRSTARRRRGAASTTSARRRRRVAASLNKLPSGDFHSTAGGRPRATRRPSPSRTSSTSACECGAVRTSVSRARREKGCAPAHVPAARWGLSELSCVRLVRSLSRVSLSMRPWLCTIQKLSNVIYHSTPAPAQSPSPWKAGRRVGERGRGGGRGAAAAAARAAAAGAHL